MTYRLTIHQRLLRPPHAGNNHMEQLMAHHSWCIMSERQINHRHLPGGPDATRAARPTAARSSVEHRNAGQIIQRGTHDELPTAGGLHADLYRTEDPESPDPAQRAHRRPGRQNNIRSDSRFIVRE
jgi:hypothetical protein